METSVKAESGKQAEKNTQGQKQSSDSDLERTLKALQDKIVRLERQLQQKGNSASAAPQQSYVRPDIVCYHCSEAGHFARECPQKQQGRSSTVYVVSAVQQFTWTERPRGLLQGWVILLSQ